jgi:hypothetical protein
MNSDAVGYWTQTGWLGKDLDEDVFRSVLDSSFSEGIGFDCATKMQFKV